jgi:hypothetical protein
MALEWSELDLVEIVPWVSEILQEAFPPDVWVLYVSERGSL